MNTEVPRYRDDDLAWGQEAAILARALELAAQRSETRVTAEDAWRATSGYAHSDAEWTEVAASAAEALGLAPKLRHHPAHLPHDCPALVRTTQGRWLVVVGRRGRKLDIVALDPRGEKRLRMTPTQVAAMADGQPWLHVAPLLALDPISATRHPRLASRPWHRLREFLRLERREISTVVIYAVVVGALTLATPVAVQALVNTVAFGAVLQPLVVLSVLLFGGLAFAALLSVLEAYVVEVLQRRAFIRIADDFGRRLPTVRTEALDGNYGPELANRFFDVMTIQKSLAVLLLDGLSLSLQTAIGMVLLGFYHPLLLAFDVVLVTLLFVVFVLGRGAVKTGLRESSAKYRTAAWLEDIARTPELFRGAGARKRAAERTDVLCRDYIAARKSHFRILLRQIAGGMGLQVIAIVALLGVGGWLVIDRQLTLGQLVAAELVITAIAAGFVKLGKNLEKLYDLNVGVLKISRVVDLPVERRGGEKVGGNGPGTATLRETSVQRGNRTLLQDIDVAVGAGDRIRLSGWSGTGKTTLLEVLAGQRAPGRGRVHLLGADLRRADLAQVRDRVALLGEPEFVSGTILDNLELVAGDRFDLERARWWLRRLDLEEAVDRLPQGLETPMQPNGSPLSRSEARRLALVRSLVAQPRLLLLDGAVDRLGLPEPRYRELLDELLGADAPWSTVVVSDEPAVAERCNRTWLIADGRLEEVQ